jgi:hypothetical protein
MVFDKNAQITLAGWLADLAGPILAAGISSFFKKFTGV